jgi:hypothetical protein
MKFSQVFSPHYTVLAHNYRLSQFTLTAHGIEIFCEESMPGCVQCMIVPEEQ